MKVTNKASMCLATLIIHTVSFLNQTHYNAGTMLMMVKGSSKNMLYRFDIKNKLVGASRY